MLVLYHGTGCVASTFTFTDSYYTMPNHVFTDPEAQSTDPEAQSTDLGGSKWFKTQDSILLYEGRHEIKN